MKQLIAAIFLAAVTVSGCSSDNKSDSQITDSLSFPKTAKNMKNLVSIVEIPTDSFQRAVAFYQSILDLRIEQLDMQGTKMGLFSGEEGSVHVALIHGLDNKPSDRGTLIYLNGGDDLQLILDKVQPNGGKIVMQKTEIDPENGFFATFIDSEGNKVGLHSFQ
ncbi:VOC family protein [Dyadobacter sp. CY351]|uniref:VOC family protein n=1 Tax=Dyadobacter sp. CY351 TaxID=2909337 RepID=UPI001F3F2F3B|nr:VOC family protein [Dyadobacter sp. CY351]MCF2518386.1 VOC family protein [Dyadobacter sp. CY351]